MSWERLRRSMYPVIGLAGILVIWQTYTALSGIPRIVLPSPLDIVLASIKDYDVLLAETWPTLFETIAGFFLALLIGIPLAVCVANSRALNLTLYPMLVATQSIPKVAIAPIILVWFGLGIEFEASARLSRRFLPCRS